jgi:hypothetical protein
MRDVAFGVAYTVADNGNTPGRYGRANTEEKLMSSTAMRSLRGPFGSILAMLLAALPACGTEPAQPSEGAAALSPVRMTAQEDHERMMDLLHITSLRRGADGNNRQSPYAANYDESKANPYPNLPDPLVLKNGQKVTTAQMWWEQRRPEIVEDFNREVYGRVPKDMPKVNWEVVDTNDETLGGIPVITKQLLGHVDNSSYPAITVDIRLTLTTSAKANGPVYRLLGKKDLEASEFPPVETGLMAGELAFRQHRGGHTTGPNWPTFLTWAERYIQAPPAARP